MKRTLSLVMGLVLIVGTAYSQTSQQADKPSDRQIPARRIPVPLTPSPALQKSIAESIEPALNVARSMTPKSKEEWAAIRSARAVGGVRLVTAISKTFQGKIEPSIMAGVKIHTITPDKIPTENRNRVIIHLHGGGYVFSGGGAGIAEGIFLADYSKIKVISVDFRLAPEDPFPAALDDTVTIMKEVMRQYKSVNIGIGGSSCGGGLAIATALKLKALKLPLPGAIFSGTPWVDLTLASDSLRTNEYIDSLLPTPDGFLAAAAQAYGGTEDLKNPLISPVYGDLKGLPPTILISGTRDIFLSDTARIHRKLRQAGVQAQLHVFEAMPHSVYVGLYQAPESVEIWQEVSRFFHQHLGK
jgi:epsilon-lactone hydrolase